MVKYDDIINMQRPISTRPAMDLSDRAKIFMPFSALKGYDETIENDKKIVEDIVELTEEKKQELDYTLQIIEAQCYDKQLEVVVSYFEKDSMSSEKKGGEYQEYKGTVGKIDRFLGIIKVGGKYISIKDIIDIKIK